jgi:hypothetical protein
MHVFNVSCVYTYIGEYAEHTSLKWLFKGSKVEVKWKGDWWDAHVIHIKLGAKTGKLSLCIHMSLPTLRGGLILIHIV